MSADLLALTPGQFEDLVADYLSAAGYQDVQRIGGAGDEGVDIRCRDDDGRLVVVQCKRYKPTSRIGSPEIQVFHGRVVRHRATDGGIFATSASFTAPAINEAQACDITLVDGQRIGAYYAQVLAERRRQSGFELSADGGGRPRLRNRRRSAPASP